MEFHGDEYDLEILKSNRSLNPWSRDIYYLHRKWRETNLGKGNGEEMFKKLEQIIHDYNTNNNQQGGRAYLQRFERKHGQSTWENTCPDDYEQPLVLAICTPLMARTHQLIQQTSELVHCDSTASLDRYNSPTFILSTATAAGGIPLGVVITSGESEDVITEALTSLKAILPEKPSMAGVLQVLSLSLQMIVQQNRLRYIQHGMVLPFSYACFIIYRVGGLGFGKQNTAFLKMTEWKSCSW